MSSENQSVEFESHSTEDSNMLQMLKESIEENQTRRILEILDGCYSIPEAKEKIKRLLKPVPEYQQVVKTVLEKDEARESKKDEENKLKKRKKEPTIKTIRINEACERYGLKRATITKLAEDAESVIRLTGLNGTTEYYCSEHYSQLSGMMDMIMGN